MPSYEVLIEVFRITEYREGAVYGTRSEGEKWVPMDEQAPNGFIYAPLSTGREKELMDQNEMTIRRVK